MTRLKSRYQALRSTPDSDVEQLVEDGDQWDGRYQDYLSAGRPLLVIEPVISDIGRQTGNWICFAVDRPSSTFCDL